MEKATVYFKMITNPETVVKKGWDFAKYEYKKVSEIFFDSDFANAESDEIMLSLIYDFHQNHSELAWAKNPNIISMIDETRSMMVDDLIEWGGVLHRVKGVGFTVLNPVKDAEFFND